MISLRQTATQLERLEALQSSTAEAYKFAIRSVAQYAVELDAADVAGFRERLETLVKTYEALAEPAQVRHVQASFRGELREYRDRAKARIDRLRQDLEAGAAAMAALAGSVASNGADHETKVKRELEHLRDVSAWDDAGKIRRGIQRAVDGIGEALEQMQNATRLTILQLQEEIQLLHRDLESRQRALITDAATGAWTRCKSDERLNELLREKEAFLVLVICVKNFRRIQERFPDRLVGRALGALVKRLRIITGEKGSVGRWSESEFVVLLDVDPVTAISFSRDASAQLSGSYALQDAGFAKALPLEVATGVCERPAGVDAESFRKRLDQLSTALARS